MIQSIRSFHYPIKNVDLGVRFYTEALGMKVVFKNPDWIALEMNGIQVGLHPEEQDIPHISRDSHGAHAGGCITFNSDNIPADRKHLEAFGAKILGEDDAPWGHMLVFEDPDGNVLKLMRAKY